MLYITGLIADIITYSITFVLIVLFIIDLNIPK